MFTLGIPLKQKRRTLGYLSNEYFPGGMKKLGQQVPYEILSSDEGFFELGFPNMDEDEFRSITFQLKQQGVTVIGADSQLTEKTMKLVNLVPLKESLQVTTNDGKVAIISDPEDIKTFYRGGTVFGDDSDGESIELSKETSSDFQSLGFRHYQEGSNSSKGTQVTDYMWRRMSDDEKIDALYSVVKDPDEAQRYFELDWEELPSGFERDMRMNELSSTGTGASFQAGTGAAYATPKAFKKKKKEVNEVSYGDFKRNTESSPRQKIAKGIRQVNKIIKEIEKIVAHNFRLKTELDMNSGTFLQSTNKQVHEIGARLKQLENKLREFSN